MKMMLAISAEVRDDLISSAIILLGALLVYLAAMRLGRRYVEKAQSSPGERGARVATLWVVLRRVILVLVLFLALLFVMMDWGWSITPFLGVGTVVAAAIGFGAQDIVKDFLSGFFILVEDQFHVGDTVTIAGTTGEVRDIQFRVTILRDFEGNVHYVPNGTIQVTTNFTSRFAQPVIDVGVAYGVDVNAALASMADELQLMARDPEFGPLITEEPEVLGVNQLGDSSVVLRARLTTLADERWKVRREALRRIKLRFDADGIEIPFPQLTISRKDDDQ